MKLGSISLCFLFVQIAACASPPGGVCAPGATVTCACPGGSVGAQTCNSGGTGFGACSCGPDDAGINLSDSGMPMVCTPGASQACVCTSGASGTQACFSDGSGFAPCTCGSPCGTCQPGFFCSGTTCLVDPASRWNVVLEDLQVPALACGGIGWDSVVSATPNESDPVVFVYVGSPSATPVQSGTASDTSFVTYTPGATVTDVRADVLQAYLGFYVYDSDVTSNDAIGGAGVDLATVNAAFAGGTQTTFATDMCTAAGTPGWGPLHWHLERF